MIYKDLSFVEYAKLPELNISRLKLFRISPAHFFSYQPKKETDALTFGKFFDTYLLFGKEALDKEFWVIDKIARANSKERQLQEAEANGRTLLETVDVEIAHAMVDEMKRSKIACGLLNNTERQLSVTWEHEGIGLKGRPDLYSAKLKAVIDLKTTTDARSHKFKLDAEMYGYFNQIAFYAWGLRENGYEVNEHFILVQEKSAPYATRKYRLCERAIKNAHEENLEFIRQYKACIQSNSFPSYPDIVEDLDRPEWIYKENTLCP